MTPSEQAAAHDANFAETFRLIADHLAGGWSAVVAGVPVAVTGVPVAFFNAAWPAPGTTPAELATAVSRLRETGAPFMVHVPAEVPALAEAAAADGLSYGGRLPCFAIEPVPIPDAPGGLRIERVTEANLAAFWSAISDGFGMPAPLVEQLYPATLIQQPSLRAFVGWLDDRPIATAASCRTASTIGIYSIATAPEARGRGIGTAMTWKLLGDAEPGWRVATLQASAMGRPVYERMGFRLVRELDEYVSTPDS